MSKKIIVLYGKGGSGKTTVIRDLYAATSGSVVRSQLDDFVAQYNYGGKVVGVNSYGDRLNKVRGIVWALMNLDCDRIVTALNAHADWYDKFVKDICKSGMYKYIYKYNFVRVNHIKSTGNNNIAVYNAGQVKKLKNAIK